MAIWLLWLGVGYRAALMGEHDSAQYVGRTTSALGGGAADAALDGRAMSGLDRELVFSALGDSSRRRLLDRLRVENGLTLSELCDGLEITRQAVTKHLKVLEAANLVVARRRGREKLHFLNPVPINAVAMRWLREFDALPLDVLAALPAEGNRD